MDRNSVRLPENGVLLDVCRWPFLFDVIRIVARLLVRGQGQARPTLGFRETLHARLHEHALNFVAAGGSGGAASPEEL
eukprot:8325939-Pyramimonas_sp.AAC.1